MTTTRILSILTLLLAAPLMAQAQSAVELLERGREAYLDYRFSDASKDYAAAFRKFKKSDEENLDKYRLYNSQLTNARNFLERVEKIVIIDSISVPREDFFKHYRIPVSSGTLGNGDDLPYRRPGVNYVFTNEGDDYKIWAETDTTGFSHLVEAMRLTDNSWSRPAPVADELSEDGDAIDPFMMSDGVTLYYASNGKESIGGYDLMVATRDAADGSFLQPQNLGFPYNSPYDDYMLAIDELNNVGWWATDRNQLDDELTVYVFIPNDLRRNYTEEDLEKEEDEEGESRPLSMTDFARISDYVATQDPDADYDQLLAEIRSIKPGRHEAKAEFHLPLPGGKIYTHFSDFRSQTASQLMKRYLAEKMLLEDKENRLSTMRREYADSRSASLGQSIRTLEQELEQQRLKLRKLLSDVYRSEQN